MSINCFSLLPSEIWGHIFSNLDWITLFKASAVSVEWHKEIPNWIFSLNLDDDRRRVGQDTPLGRYVSSFTDTYIAKFVNLHFLSLNYNKVIGNKGLMSLKYLAHLIISNNEKITNKGIKNLVNLTHLECGPKIGNEGLRFLTNLKHLDLYYANVSDEGIKHLTSLTSLKLDAHECEISNDGVKELTNLTMLTLNYGSTIDNDGLKYLTKLKYLRLNQYSSVNDEAIKHLPSLTFLDLTYNDHLSTRIDRISNEGVKGLTNLTKLKLNDLVSDEGIQGLTNLISLKVGESVSGEGLMRLNRLTSLDLTHNDLVKFSHIEHLTSTLLKLNLSSNHVIQDEDLIPFTCLRSLKLNYNFDISDNGISKLTGLTFLDISGDEGYGSELISNEGVSNLTNLTFLDVSDNFHSKVTNEGISKLTNLTRLNLCCNERIDISKLTHLVNLQFFANPP